MIEATGVEPMECIFCGQDLSTSNDAINYAWCTNKEGRAYVSGKESALQDPYPVAVPESLLRELAKAENDPE